MIIQESEPVKIWYLEMHKRKELRSKALPPDTQLVKFGTPLPAMNRFFYLEVGKKWQWTTRKSWTEQEWRDWADRKEIQTWMLLYQGTPAGYFELNTQEKDVELAYLEWKLNNFANILRVSTYQKKCLIKLRKKMFIIN